ncbi:hypothetical protein SZN_27011 [Streptomyces zinciresistens K42]|uniref:Uncharacterized protein n=1 Tax=Streptomyces zinciresistens K42 TaxID=700597 RepID=G2GIR2_9ACTN|nr:hypothetical protein SZN_27011 [Streptomyces zinciresistens K42]
MIRTVRGPALRREGRAVPSAGTRDTGRRGSAAPRAATWGTGPVGGGEQVWCEIALDG